MSYLNTVPFIYGIEHAEYLRAGLLLSPPSGCAAAFTDGLADIALLPVGALPSISDANIITDYCIGASGPVRTVVLISNSDLGDIRRIWLDAHSITSALLTRILAARHWNIAPEFAELNDYTRVDTAAPGDAFLLIGDKVFDYEGRLRNSWDLAMEWRAMTGLPFVFAVWVARDTVPQQTVEALQTALGNGTAHIREAIDRYGHSGKPYAHHYLTRNIDYVFDDQKHKALQQYWEEGRKFHPRAEPG